MRCANRAGWPMILLFLFLAGCGGLFPVSKNEQAFFDLQQKIRKDPENAQLHAKLAQWYLAEFDRTKQTSFRDAAATQLKEVIRLRPEAHWGHCTLARVYDNQGKADLALFEATEAVRLDATCPLGHRTIASVRAERAYTEETCYDDDQADLGIKEAKESIRLDPGDDYAHALLSYLYVTQGLYDLAVFESREAVRLSDNAFTRNVLGDVLSRKGDFGEAVQEYGKALLSNPRSTRARSGLVWTYFLSDRFADVLSESKEQRKSTGGRSGPMDVFLCLYFAMRQTAKADEAQQLIAEFSRNFRGGEWQSALLQYYLGKAGEAEIMAKTKHRCDRASVSFYLGYDSLMRGDRDKAREYFQRAVDDNVPGLRAGAGAKAMLERLGGH